MARSWMKHSLHQQKTTRLWALKKDRRVPQQLRQGQQLLRFQQNIGGYPSSNMGISAKVDKLIN